MLRSISQDDLAPPPSQEDIFGQIDAVKKQFEEDHELIARQFEENKVSFEIIFLSLRSSFDNFPQMRMEANFQEKLAERRRRRARHNMEEKELAELGGEEDKEDVREDERKEKKEKKEKKHHKKKKEKKEKKHKKDKSDDHQDAAADERYEE